METAIPRGLPAAHPSPPRAWCYLVWLSFLRQAQVRQMVWMAVGLLVLSLGLVALTSAKQEWAPWRMLVRAKAATALGLLSAPSPVAPFGTVAAWKGSVLEDWLAVMRFSQAVVFDVLMGFLLPLWSLSFATQALGTDREERSLIWLLSRPLPRPAIYLARYIGILPWTMLLNLGGFWLLCQAGGVPGKLALPLYWPAVVLGTLAYAALFHLMGAIFRRPAVVAIVYTFFVETFLGSMPGAMKRISISFFDRCLMISAAERFHMQPPAAPDIYMPVSGATACLVLTAGTVCLLIIGATLFARMEYTDLT